MSVNKYPSIFSRQMEAIVYILHVQLSSLVHKPLAWIASEDRAFDSTWKKNNRFNLDY